MLPGEILYANCLPFLPSPSQAQDWRAGLTQQGSYIRNRAAQRYLE
jgi:hypothetical protein